MKTTTIASVANEVLGVATSKGEMMRLSEQFLKDHAAKPMELFIETGTGTGAGLQVASKIFDRCMSIEQDKGWFDKAAKDFKATDNVALYWNDSPSLLNSWPMGSKSTTFWLDAHYGGVGPSPAVECPLLAELAAISKAKWKTKPVILIDDAYYFTDLWWRTNGKAGGYDRLKWPTRTQIEAAASLISGGLKLEGFSVRGKDKVYILR